MAYVDRNERYRFTNRAYEAALGLSRERTFGMSIREALGDQRYAMLKSDIDAAFRGERRVFELELPSGREMRLYLGAYIPHVDERGEVAGFFTLYQDITEQREAESILREAKATLENRVAERTRDLTRLNEQLGEAKAAAEAANLGKTRFLAAASHDLLQPLHAARLFSASLGEAPLDGRSKDIVGQIEQALGAVDELLRALLDISKLDAGGSKPDRRAFVLGDVLEGLAASFAPVADSGGVDFRIVPTRLAVESDPTLLRRILQNFLANAIRYGKGGKVLLGCRRRGNEVRIDVWDTGPGIPDDKREAIFEEFRRLDDAEDGGPPGLGLGLAIVDRIARMLDHKIELRSWPGRGSVFSVVVPLAARKVVPASPAFRAMPAARSSLVGRVVLAIDNDRTILEGMRALLEGWSAIALVATDVAEARQLLARHGGPPDIVLVDHHLGSGETGFDALDALADALPRDVPTVLITANRTDEVRDLARARRVPILLKPVRPAALRALVTQLVAPAAETVAAE
jgi:PAS domain S-box-containing protein